MNSVVKGTGYILVHTPDMVIHNGTTQTTERVVNPESEYLKELPGCAGLLAQPDLYRQCDPRSAG